eukprot:CAMPEP_0175173988 /NCGR_PEP_ID=MMETSP0087-20121206/32371_1 /TAXON_ID=136419 /ORGANISM="Unknown Unknown, Strain D1" /LENGTH=163 /DNA_ID=CAMNT_0016465385 /DNA_START=36 /DNA_END=524 /DNA_ORIENTATION=-
MVNLAFARSHEAMADPADISDEFVLDQVTARDVQADGSGGTRAGKWGLQTSLTGFTLSRDRSIWENGKYSTPGPTENSLEEWGLTDPVALSYRAVVHQACDPEASDCPVVISDWFKTTSVETALLRLFREHQTATRLASGKRSGRILQGLCTRVFLNSAAETA